MGPSKTFCILGPMVSFIGQGNHETGKRLPFLSIQFLRSIEYPSKPTYLEIQIDHLYLTINAIWNTSLFTVVVVCSWQLTNLTDDFI